YMVPSLYQLVDGLPVNANGKLDRRALTPLVKRSKQRPNLSQSRVEATTDTQQAIETIWQEILQLDEVGIFDNFFDLGGTSLLAMSAIPTINRSLLSNITIAQFFDLATISGLAKHIDSESEYASTEPRLNTKPAKMTRESQDIAIIGFACRVPGANNADEFWRNLTSSKESITFFDDSELHHSIDESLKSNSSYVKARGVLNHHDCFDHEFFGLPSIEADILDPQQRVLIELSHTALEHAKVSADDPNHHISVYAGVGDNRYFTHNLLGHSVARDLGEHRLRLANEKDYVAPRIAYCLDTKGPAISVHTACSTSLVAVSQGVQGLREGSSNMALCGGAFIPCPQNTGYLHAEGGFASADGHCRPFDADASGTVFSAGAGMVVLQPLADAEAAGHTIYGVIKGVGVTNDGGGKMSFMAPSSDGQASAIQAAIDDAGVDVSSITFIEAHGTATPLGDPIELSALAQVYRADSTQPDRLIGSVKSNIGHTDAAAGVVGLIKSVLSLHHGQLPASLGYQSPNPNIDFNAIGFIVNQQLTKLSSRSAPHRCGVSAFGVGGTNAHLIVEQYRGASSQAAIDKTLAPRTSQLLLFSAKSHESRKASIIQTQALMDSGVSLDRIAQAQAQAQSHYGYRSSLVTSTATATLNSNDEEANTRPITNPPDVVFMFPGQGTQSVGMTWQLYEQEPIYRNTIDECAAILTPILGGDIRGLLYPDAFERESNHFIEQNSGRSLLTLMSQTQYAQPALFMVGLGLARWFMAINIRPAAVVGHSIGEYVAAHLAGIFTLSDALKLVSDRGRVMQSQPSGAMVAVSLSEAALSEIITLLAINKRCALAAVNAPGRTVASGEFDAIDKLIDHLDENEINCRRLNTSHAFHSPMMSQAASDFKACFNDITLKPPVTPLMSTASGQWLTANQATDPDYWTSHLRDPVRFATAVESLWQERDYLLLELGPKGGAAFLARQVSQHPLEQVAVASLNRENDEDMHALLSAVGRLWSRGVAVDWCAFYKGRECEACQLPAYSFRRDRHWLEPDEQLHNSTRLERNTPSSGLESTASSLPDEQDIEASLQHMIGDMTGLTIDTDLTTLSFIELGLDSLSMTQLVIAIKRRFNVSVSLRQLAGTYSNCVKLTGYVEQRAGHAMEAMPVVNITTHSIVDGQCPPVLGAKLGRSTEGNPSWYMKDPDQPGRYLKIEAMP
ncbi:acyltransferase domain-containing protein, partial [bacterium]|nr:acyltransferase domain-containing protein [bacterium]